LRCKLPLIKQMSKENNELLISNIKALKLGNRAAFEYIYHCFGPKLHAFAGNLIHHPQEAEEVVQEVFLKLWERKHFLDPEQHFDSYLFKIARNIVYHKARHQVYALAYGKYLQGQQSPARNATQEQLDYQELRLLLASPYGRGDCFFLSAHDKNRHG
jgi:RNA polymerase sigma-70 factor, ECF subfamily